MLTEICAWLKNYFCQEEDKIIGNFAVVNGAIVPSVNLQDGQYYRIVGSVFNDGVHAYGDILTDEERFHGAVWKMRIPEGVVSLSEEIADWVRKYGDISGSNMSPFTSESFGGYSYSKGSRSSSGAAGGGGGPLTWQNMFRHELLPYMRIRV